MLYKQQIFAIVVSLLFIGFIIVLIRRGKLREEYAILWLVTAVGVVVMTFFYGILVFITDLIGAIAPTTTLFIFALLFLLSLAIHFSIKISQQSDQIKDLTQEIALLRKKAEDRDSPGEDNE